MTNRWLLNLALALLVGILVLLAIYKPGSRKEPESTPLTTVRMEDVTRLRLLRSKQPDVVLEKLNGKWQLTAPYPARANSFRASDLASLAAAPVRTRFTARPEELEKFGLHRPLATLFLNEAEIRFGAMHPLHNEIYVLHAGQVHLVTAAAFRSATVPVEDLLSLALLDDDSKLVALRLPGFSLKQNDQGTWVRTPELKELGSDRINRFVDEWRNARALSVTPARRAMPRERVVITISEGDKTRALEFGIAARQPELVLVRLDEKLEYHFLDDAVGRLLELKPEPTPPAADTKAAR